MSWKSRTRSAVSPPLSANRFSKRRKTRAQDDFQKIAIQTTLPATQITLQLHATRTPYQIDENCDIPEVQNDHELLLKVNAVGLNPIDWKSPDFNFGVPSLPFVSGRELVGTVLRSSATDNTRIREGDLVIVPSTDYRDYRKAAFQQYSIASDFNAIRLPRQISVESGSILGVAFVSAVLALGVCMGLDFKSIESGPDLLEIIRGLDPEAFPQDIREECLRGIDTKERAKSGSWLVIWGGSSTCAHVAKQIARLAGLKIISVVDGAKHGLRLSSTPEIRPDLVVDSHDPERAIEIIKRATGNHARFGFDTTGKETAGHLLRSLATSKDLMLSSVENSKHPRGKDSKLPSPPSTPLGGADSFQRSHLVGLTGLPKNDIPDNVSLHSVPIKLFHEVPEIGEALSAWCENLLLRGLLVPPEVVGTLDGLENINEGLDRMRKREISGGRLVAVLP